MNNIYFYYKYFTFIYICIYCNILHSYIYMHNYFFVSCVLLRFDFPEWRNVPGSNFLGHVLRELDTSGYNTGKLVLDPRGVLQMEVHSVHEHIDGGRTERVSVVT